LEDKGETQNPKNPAQETHLNWWAGLVGYIQRRADEHKAKKQAETPQDRASRVTANATHAIAWLTLAVALIAGLQLWELIQGGDDTKAIATAAQQQACAARQIAAASERNAAAAEGFATSAGHISDGVGSAVKKLEAQAKATQKSAGAAESAAGTAIQALHISERAYIVTGQPTIDTDARNIVLPIINSGRIPSGEVTAVIHEATLPVSTPGVQETKIFATEVHWKRYKLESIPTTGTVINFNIPIPALNAEDVTGGRQQIIIVGVLTYNDGFSGDADQQWPFCYGNAMLPQSKSLQWVICDPNLYLREAIEADHYPQNESKYRKPN
jgi:hypothetical protein